MLMSVDLEPVQLVGPDGTPTAERRYHRDIPEETLRWLYEMMVVTREAGYRIRQSAAPGGLALYTTAGGKPRRWVRRLATQNRLVVPQYRELGVYLVRGIPRLDMLGSRGVEPGTAGCNSPQCCAPMSVPIGTRSLHAVGAAMAAQRLNERTVTVALSPGDGATSGATYMRRSISRR